MSGAASLCRSPQEVIVKLFLLPAPAVRALALAILISGCSSDAPPPSIAVVDGPCGDVYGASVCTWAEVEGDQVVRVGATIPLAAIQNAPDDAEMVWPPELAALVHLPDVARDQMGIHHVKIYWEAHGHPPGPYLTPHFDFHFFTITAEETNAIDCSDLSKPTELPEGYASPDVDIPGIGILIGLCVPGMGMHALLEEEMESEVLFEGTLVVGYYADAPIFFEPMITRDLLLQRQTFSLDFPTIVGAGSGVVLPTKFDAVYDAEASAYRFVFSGFPVSEVR